MSAIALVLRAMGHHVSGSDLKDSPVAERLRSQGITVAVGHAPEQRGGRRRGDVLARRAAGERGARPRRVRRGIRVVPRSEMLAAICATRRCLAVSGTHGKTTTASMLSLILVEAGLRPSFVIGADVNEIGTNAVWDTGEWLVVEADESYGTFQAIRPDLAVLTNVEPDHLDYYGTFDVLRARLRRLRRPARRMGSVVCADDPEAAAIGREHGATTVGSDPGLDLRDGPTSSCNAARCPSPCADRRAPLGTRRTSASRACTTRGTGRRPWWRRCRPGRPSRRPRRRWPASPG